MSPQGSFGSYLALQPWAVPRNPVGIVDRVCDATPVRLGAMFFSPAWRIGFAFDLAMKRCMRSIP